MKGNSFFPFVKVLLFEKSALRIALGVGVGMAFSIAVILSTIGIMDGFELTLKKSLKRSMGDIYFYKRDGFFQLDKEDKQAFDRLGINRFTEHIQSEAFLVFDETSKGVSLRGIDPESFSKVTDLKINLKRNHLAIGSELAKALNVGVGEDLILVLAKGNKDLDGLPLLQSFKISDIVEHRVYQKDLRYVYILKEQLNELLNLEGRVNVVAITLPTQREKGIDLRMDAIQDFIFVLEEELGNDFRIRPYWYDFSTLLEALKIEKKTIGLILQIIVVIAIFNVIAFVTYLNEKRSQEIFLFMALGMAKKQAMGVWFKVILLLWTFACFVSIFMTQFFAYALKTYSVFKLPGDVYTLAGGLELSLRYSDYGIVFISALAWLLFISMFALWRIKQKSILHGLRREFA
jgi:ABC-type lipoprotein release transport system permease subunit